MRFEWLNPKKKIYTKRVTNTKSHFKKHLLVHSLKNKQLVENLSSQLAKEDPLKANYNKKPLKEIREELIKKMNRIKPRKHKKVADVENQPFLNLVNKHHPVFLNSIQRLTEAFLNFNGAPHHWTPNLIELAYQAVLTLDLSWVGACIVLEQHATMPELVGKIGLIKEESATAFHIITSQNETKTIPKLGGLFKLGLLKQPGQLDTLMVIPGSMRYFVTH